MRLLIAGNLTESIIKALREYGEDDLVAGGMIEDVLESVVEGRKGEYERIILVDTGLSTLKDWGKVRRLKEKYKGVPLYLFTRYKDLTPEESYFGEQFKVISTGNKIFIRDIVSMLREDV